MERRYYVYELVDPRDNSVFYVGKGSGSRCYQHEKDAKAGGHSSKLRRIRDIQALGLAPTARKVREFVTEDAAYNYEKRLIAKHGLDKLTNIVPGGKLEWEAKADKDLLMVKVLAILAKKTAGFNIQVMMRFCGHFIPLPQEFNLSMRKKVGELVMSRGEQWAVKQFAKHGVSLRAPEDVISG